MSKLILYDNTRLSDAKSCLRYYLLRHIYHWSPVGDRLPLTFGSGWHAMMEVVWPAHKDLYGPSNSKKDVIDAAYAAFLKVWMEEGKQPHPDDMSPDDLDAASPRTPMIALEMLYGYIDARENIFTDPSFSVLAVEAPFIVPLDPENESLWYVGRMDKEFMYRKRAYAGEHKTTALYRVNGGFSSDWVDSWSMDDQTDGYGYNMLHKYGKQSGGVWIDGALVHKKVHEFFKIIPLEKQPQQLDAWLYDTHTWIDSIEANKEVLAEREQLDTPYLAAFPRNRRSCVGKYGKCAFFDLCRAHANPAKIKDQVPLGFEVSPWQPFDQLKLEGIINRADVADSA